MRSRQKTNRKWTSQESLTYSDKQYNIISIKCLNRRQSASYSRGGRYGSNGTAGIVMTKALPERHTNKIDSQQLEFRLLIILCII